MPIRIQAPDGSIAEFPDGTPEPTIEKAMRDAYAAPSGAADVAASAGSGVVKGMAGMIGLPELGQRGVTAAMDWMTGKKAPEQPVSLLPSAEAVQQQAERVTGPLHKPQTKMGDYAQTIGEFLPNMVSPGSAGRKLIAGVLAPAIASESAGQYFKGKPGEGGATEGIARVTAALLGAGGASGAMSLRNSRRAGVADMSPGASRALEERLAPNAEGRLAELGPNAMLLDSGTDMLGLAQGVGVRGNRSSVVDPVRVRHAGANQRLRTELDDTLGPAVSPRSVEEALENQRNSLHPLYEQVTGLNNPVQLDHVYDQLRTAIPQEAGATQSALRRVLDMVAPETGGAGSSVPRQRLPRTSPREVLNVRQALDDLHGTLGETPKAQRAVGEYRRLVDSALADAVPDIKVLDETFSNLKRGSDALKSGSNIMKTGPEAIRPEDLIADRRTMSLPQREAQRLGARAELDRVVGTKANDMVALKKEVMSEGKWNPVKLAEVFGAAETQRIMRATNREAAFADSYNKIVENSQTEMRKQAAQSLDASSASGPSMIGASLWGIGIESLRKGARGIRESLSNGRMAGLDQELGPALTRTNATRDHLVQQLREAQQRRSRGSTTPSKEITRLLMALEAGSVPSRERRR